MDGGLHIRLATAEDTPGISEVLFAAFSPFREEYTSEAFEAVTPKPDEIRGRFDEGPIWVGVDEGKIVGTVSVVPEPEWLYIRSMAVSPWAQGLGIGGKLLGVIELYAVENGFDRLYLYTTNVLAGAIRLYERHGFTLDRYTPPEEWFGVAGQGMDKKLERNDKQNAARS